MQERDVARYFKLDTLEDSGADGRFGAVAEVGLVAFLVNQWQLVAAGTERLEAGIDAWRDVASPIASFLVDELVSHCRARINDQQVLSGHQVVGSNDCRQSVHTQGFRCLVSVLDGYRGLPCQFHYGESRFCELPSDGLAQGDDRCNDAPLDGILAAQHRQAVQRVVRTPQHFHHFVLVEDRKLGDRIAYVYY